MHGLGFYCGLRLKNNKKKRVKCESQFNGEKENLILEISRYIRCMRLEQERGIRRSKRLEFVL